MTKFLKLLSFVLVLCMLVSLIASCTGEKSDTNTDNTQADTNDTTTDENDTPNTEDTNTDDTNDDNSNTNDQENEGPAPDGAITLPTEELCAALASSIYQIDSQIPIKNDKNFGLTEPMEVGINKDRFENEVLYPVPDDSEFVKIFNVTDYEVSTESENNSAAINAIIEEAKAIEGLKKIYFPKGVYKVSNTISFLNAKDIYFCGDEAEFLGTRWFAMFSIKESQNIHFNGLRVDFDPSPVVSGTAVSYDPIEKTATYKIDDEYDITKCKDWIQYIWSYMEHEYDEFTGQYYPTGYGNILLGDSGWAQLVPFKYERDYNEETRELIIRFKAGAKEVAVGTRASFALANKTGTCFTGYQSDYLYWEDINVYCNPGMVFLYYNGSNIFFNNANILLREGSTRMMSATSDSMHFVDVQGQVKVTNCTIQASLDDCMNIKTRYRTITSIDGNTIVSDKASYSSQSFYHVGDAVEFFDPADLSSRGYFTITELQYEDYTWTLTFDKEVPPEYMNSVFANDTTSTELIVDNNIFGNKRNRGFLVQCRDVTITNNVFANFVHGGIIIHSVRDVYGEGMVPKNVTIKNNKFFNNYDSDIIVQSWGTQKSSPGIITGIVIENNFFAHTQNCPINVKTAGGAIIKNNMFYNICEGAEKLGISSDFFMAIAVAVCEDMTVSNNLLYTDTEVKRLKVTGHGSMYTEVKRNIYQFGE